MRFDREDLEQLEHLMRRVLAEVPFGVSDDPRERYVADGLLKPKDAAEFCGVSLRHLHNLIDRGEVPVVRLGRARRVPKHGLVRYLAANLNGDPDVIRM